MFQMDGEFEACSECSMNCLLIHQRRHDRSPRIPPFFKVMFGKKFSEEMFLPPNVSGILGSSVGKKVRLEDLTGMEMEVVLSEVRGSLAFQEGWSKFSKHQRLMLGDFVVFHHITGTRFIVEIYGRNGCEKTCSSEKSNQNKRPKTDTLFEERTSPQGNDYCNAYAVSSSDNDMSDFILSQDDVNDSFVMEENVQSPANVIEKPQLVPDVDLIKPCFLADRKTSSGREADREHLFDLSAFEMPDRKPKCSRKDDEDKRSDPSISNETSKTVDVGEDLGDHLFDQSPSNLFDTIPSISEKGYGECVSNPPISNIIDKKADVLYKGNLQGNTSQVSGAFLEARTGSTSIDTKKLPSIQGKPEIPSKNDETNISSSKHSPVPSVSPNLPLNSMPPPKLFGKLHTSEPSAASGISQSPDSDSIYGGDGGTKRVVKQEPREFKQDLSGNVLGNTSFRANLSFDKEAKKDFSGLGMSIIPKKVDFEVIKDVKSEPIDMWDSPSTMDCRIICSIPPDNESFLELPEPLPMNWRQRQIKKHKLIFLRDPIGRTWPVLYHRRNNLVVLASGWKDFRKANMIHTGDECAFVPEYANNGAFQFQILNR